jgi:hypothetical protein
MQTALAVCTVSKVVVDLPVSNDSHLLPAQVLLTELRPERQSGLPAAAAASGPSYDSDLHARPQLSPVEAHRRQTYMACIITVSRTR